MAEVFVLILVAGSDPGQWQAIQKALSGRFVVTFAVDLRGTLDLAAQQRPPVLVLCSNLLDADVETCLERVGQESPRTRFVVIRDGGHKRSPRQSSVAHSCIDAESVPRMLRPMVEALITPPRSSEMLKTDASSAVATRGDAAGCAAGDLFDRSASRPMVLGTSAAMRRVAEVIRRVAQTDVTLLLCGETGTGKELFARRIHSMSERAGGPFVAVSLPAVPAELFESVMFGHERGAFTGAVAQRVGAFEKAERGTLLLDEVSSLKLECQPKLLRAIQEREIERVGGRGATACDVRIIAATNVDLRDMVAEQSFRDDLYHRLGVITIDLPPLRRRPEDIPLLLDFFVDRYAREYRCEVPDISPDALRALQHYPWPGNVRELQNRVQQALLLSRRDRPLCAEDFLDETAEQPSLPLRLGCCHHSLASVERAYIEQVLEHTQGNQSRAAQILEIDRKTLRAKLQRYADPGEQASEKTVILRSA